MQKVEDLLLDALRGKNQGRPPVWLMRQAGRYLPSYRALRERYSLRELFLTPELAAEVTMMPIELLGVDAAILFSDITVVALALGLRLDFAEGPKVDPPITPQVVPFLPVDFSRLSPMIETVSLLKKRLTVPLIGFCGAPFTVASYLVEGGLDALKKWTYQCPDVLDRLLEKIADISVVYLQQQIHAGADAIQLFDSWANVLSRDQFRRFCLPYYRKIFGSISVPPILFLRGAALYLDDLKDLPCALSMDWQVPLCEIRKQTKQVLQGNIDPDLLYAPLPVIREKVIELLVSMRGDHGFIAGLGHGVKRDMPVDAVKELVQTIQQGAF